MFFVWSGHVLRGIYESQEKAFSVARAVTGASHITEQEVEAGCVHPAVHYWFV